MENSKTISIIHFSDIHFSDSNSILNKNIPNTLSSQDLSENILILVTGDIANTGREEEYEIAKVFFNDIKRCLAKKNVEIIFAPGNHDCDFSLDQLREDFINDSWPKHYTSPDKKYMQYLLKVQQPFYEFCQDFGQINPNEEACYQIESKHSPVKINIINSAIVSRLRESKGEMLYPLNCLKNIQKDNTKLNLTIYHHPECWLHKNVENDFKDLTSAFSDFIFTGHEHNEKQIEERKLGGTDFKYLFRSGTLQETKDSDISEFNILNYNFKHKTASILQFKWDKESEYYTKETLEDKLIIPDFHNKGLFPSSQFKDFLDDPGISINHSHKKDLTLSDFYSFPTLSIDAKDILSKKAIAIVDCKDDFLEYVLGHKKVLISGEADTGKTSLSKILTRSLLKESKVPVHLRVSDFNATNKGHIKNKVEEQLTFQFGKITFDKAMQSFKEDLFIIFDEIDISDTSLNLTELIENIEEIFDNIILFSSKDYLVEIDVTDFNNPEDAPLISFARMTLKDLSKISRSKLIKKWITLGQYNTDDDINKLTRIERHLEEQIINFSIPKRPVYLLTMLQHYETESNYDINCSSNAHAIDMLIKMNLATSGAQRIKPNLKTSYLEELAFHLLNEDKDFLDDKELSIFHEDYNKTKGREINKKDIWLDLVDNHMGIYSQNRNGFKYKYLKYYFIALYLSKRVTTEEAQSSIAKILQNLEVSQNANVISFLSLFTYDFKIIETLVKQLKDSLSNYEESNIDQFSRHFLEKLNFDNIELDLKRIDSELFPTSQDISEESSEFSREESENKEDDSPNKESTQKSLKELNYSLRLMRLIGQVLKNSIENLNADEQYTIVEEVYKLGLRLITYLEKGVLDNADDLMKYVYIQFRKSDPSLTKLQVIQSSNVELANLVFKSIVGIILRVTSAVGHEDMKVIYNKICQSENKAYSIFDLNIRISFFKKFPQELLINEYQKYQGNNVVRPIIRFLTLQAIGISNERHDKIQSICRALGIDYKKYLVKRLTL